MSAPSTTYTTIAGELRHEIDKVKGSRFIATIAPAADAVEAKAFVDRIGAEFTDATHNCFAWRLGPDGSEFRYSDDGEPSGSAGRPMLEQIAGRELTGLAAVVTRYFGGTKLGVGGLMRAYGGALAAALDLAPRRTVVMKEKIVLSHPYSCSSAVAAVLSAAGLEPIAADYGAEVRLELRVPLGETEELVRELIERSAGLCRRVE